MKLRPLKTGDLITIAAPAGPFDRRRFLQGVSLLRKAGFRVVFRKDIFARNGYLAGRDSRRAAELRCALADRRSRALLFARGGYGSQRILPFLGNQCAPKVVVGSSDLTVILNHLWKRFRLPSLYGAMVAPHLGRHDNVLRLSRALTDRGYLQDQRLSARKVIRPGRAEGVLVGGCLSLVISTLGTPWEIETKGSLLFLEDTNEEPYEVDRMLTQLEQAGKFRAVRGIVFGTFRGSFRGKKTFFHPGVEKVVREKFKTFRGPVLWGLRFGHCSDPLLIPIGGRGRIEGKGLSIQKGIF